MIVTEDGWQVILRYGFDETERTRSFWKHYLLDEYEPSAGKAALTALDRLDVMIDDISLRGVVR